MTQLSVDNPTLGRGSTSSSLSPQVLPELPFRQVEPAKNRKARGRTSHQHRELYDERAIVAYTVDGQPLTRVQYVEQIHLALHQIEEGKVLTDEELEKEIETW